MHIESGSVGHSYDQTFGHLLDDMVTSVEVDDPYVRSAHQVQNFVRLCELLKKKCPCLRSVKLTTGLDQARYRLDYQDRKRARLLSPSCHQIQSWIL
uniref:Microtubule interacting and transport (MIT) domain containing protein n=1 Tax=Rhipicephalus zambeziensis TaxID=60191 RepID=A0A224Z4H6_9ACAR